MKATLRSYYRKTGGRIVFVFGVSGTKQELDAYKAAQGDNYREDEVDKTPLFFNTQSYGVAKGKSIGLLITNKGNVVVDDLNSIVQEDAMIRNVRIQEVAKLQARQQVLMLGADEVMNAMTTPEPADVPEITP